MNLSRLMVLGLLASQGARHGHQIRREAEQTNVSNWGGVSVGALYREIGRMAEEGLVEPVRTEQVGLRPTRTVYRITDAGLRNLGLLREEAIRELQFGPDAFGVALLFGRTWAKAELLRLLAERRSKLAGALAGIRAEGSRLRLEGKIGPLDSLMFRRREMQIEAELRWYEESERAIDDLPTPETPSSARDTAGDGSEAEASPKKEPRARRKPKPGRKS